MKLTNIFHEKRHKRMSIHTKIENRQKLNLCGFGIHIKALMKDKEMITVVITRRA